MILLRTTKGSQPSSTAQYYDDDCIGLAKTRHRRHFEYQQRQQAPCPLSLVGAKSLDKYWSGQMALVPEVIHLNGHWMCHPWYIGFKINLTWSFGS